MSEFSRTLSVALASPSFVEETKPELLARWRQDLGRFTLLRRTVGLRYAERVDWRDYEKRIRQLLDRHVVAREVVTLVPPLNIFDDIEIESRRNAETDASIADTIAHRLTRSIEMDWDEDPIFFEKFSKLVQETIAAFHNGRISELAYLTKIRELRDKVQSRQDDTDPTPSRLRDDPHAQAFWGLARRNLEKAGFASPELAADIALRLSAIIQKRRKVGWQNDRDVENLIRNDIDDFFFEELRGRDDRIDPKILDGIVDDVLASARVRLGQ
jgi:type I restriction enzyme, R subunit